MESSKNTQRQQRREKLSLPRYTLSEEIVNAITHGLGAAFAVVALVILLVECRKDTLTVVSVAVYGGTMFMLYTVSTMYHALGINRAKKVFQVLDHCTIYLLIAGTYTPISLLVMGTPGIVLCAVVWAVAIAGVVLNAVNMKKFRVVSMVCYIALGWCIVLFVKSLLENLTTTPLILLLAGGVLYTVGAVLYGKGRKVRYMHGVWHLFCLGGSFLHFLVIYGICV